MQQQTPPEQFDLAGMVADLNNLLRLKTTVIGMKLFATVEEMTAIPKIRRPSAIHSPSIASTKWTPKILWRGKPKGRSSIVLVNGWRLRIAAWSCIGKCSGAKSTRWRAIWIP